MPESKQYLHKKKNWKHSVENVLQGVGSLVDVMPHRQAYCYSHEAELAALRKDMCKVAGDMMRAIRSDDRVSHKFMDIKVNSFCRVKGSVKKNGTRKPR